MTRTLQIAPDPRGGARLLGQGMRAVLWYDDECNAAFFAQQILLRLGGGRIVFYDSHGSHIITERVKAVENMRRSADAMH